MRDARYGRSPRVPDGRATRISGVFGLPDLLNRIPVEASGGSPVKSEFRAFFFFDRAIDRLSIGEVIVGWGRGHRELKLKGAFTDRRFGRWYVERVPVDGDLVSHSAARLERDRMTVEGRAAGAFAGEIARDFGQFIDFRPGIDTEGRGKFAATGADGDETGA